MISVASGAIAMVITKLGWIMEPWIWMSIFTGSTLFSTIYSYILMPETQGLSLEEIKQLYKPITNKVNLPSGSIIFLTFASNHFHCKGQKASYSPKTEHLFRISAKRQLGGSRR